jgi:cytochrome c-type biogenesis protein CcmE
LYEKNANPVLAVNFELTDHGQCIPVSFIGTLPDLFHKGQGIVAVVALKSAGTFEASEILAKHDENCMPPEIANVIKRAGKMFGKHANYGSKAVQP